MQKDEIIIEGFIKTINESSLNVTGDPVLLDRVFDALEKKKKKRRFLAFFMVLTVVVCGLSVAIWGNYYRNNQVVETQNMIGLTKHTPVDLNADLMAVNTAEKENVIVPAEKINKPVVKKRNPNLTVSYKFNNHQVDVHQQESEEFVQINVFGSDGSEIDVFKMMEDLKESYKNKEVYVDSTNNEAPRKLYKTVRNPVVN